MSSDYKHRNTVKFLVVIEPSAYITFLSNCYKGIVSDHFSGTFTFKVMGIK